MTASPCRSAMRLSSSRSGGCPPQWVQRIALVNGVMRRSTSAGSMFPVSYWMSANTTRANCSRIGWLVRVQVIGVAIRGG